MSRDYAKIIDEKMAANIINEFNETKEREKEKRIIKNIVYSVLKTMDGKKITKRFETTIKSVLPEYVIYYTKGYTYYEIRVWGKSINHNNAMSFDLALLSGDGVFNYNDFIKDDRYKHIDDNVKSMGLLTDDIIKEKIKLYNEAVKEIKAFKDKEFNLLYPLNNHFSFNFYL